MLNDMVEYTFSIDEIFSALADPVRRDIVDRADQAELSVNEIALEYDMSLAAISKHLKVLREAGLIFKRRKGRFQLIRTNRAGLLVAEEYLVGFRDSATPRSVDEESGENE
jgi:DNA-binding transcriptional ArsR family regulator